MCVSVTGAYVHGSGHREVKDTMACNKVEKRFKDSHLAEKPNISRDQIEILRKLVGRSMEPSRSVSPRT